ncbi:NUDIX domain-containing protein [Rhizobium mesosinicum]|uniref:GDP-mannose pyrophosphatase n=1 Tax=Rhizobium mesosinicum TaxID=335017 RepID=A0ABS7GTW0_9HYPH|nr:NUDIX domain-containing protein [Rhizobium mesosinicum]MBW9053097.1 NUDIX domain-containing protein [Rhizobium mesosinicum]
MTQSKAKVEIAGKESLSDGWTKLVGYQLDYTDSKGETHRLPREVYHRTPAACILLYDPKRDIVVLVKQFRLPAYLNGDPAWMIEVPAGLLDGDEPEAAIRREAMEETGYMVREVRFLFKSYTAPGSITEVVHFFAAMIDNADRASDGGGLEEEHEDIEVLEIPLSQALAMIEKGELIDLKTITLLQWLVVNKGLLGA